jgi:hypothetical protein
MVSGGNRIIIEESPVRDDAEVIQTKDVEMGIEETSTKYKFVSTCLIISWTCIAIKGENLHPDA